MSPEVIGRLAQQYSTCGSAQKTPDASFKMLRGRPGELTFKRGEMAKEFENVAFTAPVGSLSVVDTQFGSHLIYINARDDADPKAGRGRNPKNRRASACGAASLRRRGRGHQQTSPPRSYRRSSRSCSY